MQTQFTTKRRVWVAAGFPKRHRCMFKRSKWSQPNHSWWFPPFLVRCPIVKVDTAKSRPHDVTLRRASYGICELCGPPIWCAACLIFSNNEKLVFVKFILELDNTLQVYDSIQIKNTRAEEEAWPAFEVLNVSRSLTIFYVILIAEIDPCWNNSVTVAWLYHQPTYLSSV